VTLKLTRKETSFIKEQGVARLATMGEDDMPHNVPVCPLFAGNRVYVASEKGAAKVRNLQANPKAAVVFDVYRDSWKELRGVMLKCSARLVDEKEFKRIRRKFYAKYPHYEKDAPLEPDESVIIELSPEKKFSLGFE